MKIYDPNMPLFSLHIPKCGGTSLLRALQMWFSRSGVIEHYPRQVGPLPNKRVLAGPICVHGHFNASRGFGIPQYYPQADQFITFLRDPFDRYLSLWFYQPTLARQRGRNIEKTPKRDFGDYLCRRAKRQQSHAYPESMIWYFPQSPNVTDIVAQMDRSFVFVGIMERYQESLDALAAVLGKKRVKIPHLNDTPREENDYERWRPFYREHFAEEYEIYDAALARNEELIRSYGH